MKIAFIISEFPSISETFIVQQITGLLDRKHDVEIFAIQQGNAARSPAQIHPAIMHYRLLEKTHYYFNSARSKWSLRLGVLSQIAKWTYTSPARALNAVKSMIKETKKFSYQRFFLEAAVSKNHFDAVFCHFGINGRLAVNIKRSNPGILFLTMFHGYGVRIDTDQARNDYRDLFKYSDLLLANSAYTHRQLIKFGAAPEKTVIHPVGIDTSVFALESPIHSSENPEEIIILSVGRLVKEKGYEHAIRAFAETIPKCPNSSLKYLIIGDGPLKQQLNELVVSLNLEKQVIFLGALTHDQIKPIYQKAHIFLLSSIAEAFGLVLLEAQAMELPIVASNVDGTQYAVDSNHSALMVKPGNTQEMSDRLVDLIVNPQRREIMGKAGRQFVIKNFEISSLNDRLDTMLIDHHEKLIKESSLTS